MFALSTDSVTETSKDEEEPFPKRTDSPSKTSRTSLQEIELEKRVERNGQEQPV